MFPRRILLEEATSMSSRNRLLAVLALVLIALAGCRGEKSNEPEAFSFVLYPGSRYLPQLTDLTKQAHKVISPTEEPPPTAIYDTEAPVEQVAEFYAKSYGYNTVAPDATNNLSAAKPPAFYRSGDLQTDVQQVLPVTAKMNLKVDPSKAVGKYKAAEIAPKSNRPRVTVQRPYFDVTTSQVVDRTLILMAR
jgi:hypothetical protein